ncbi:hypothetical protein E1267_43185 [Nonomuraea longispora]|uniref:Uncharacterized protein n=1 Tax=Nonomuraea longispora TaxID=1848320 RepID=A0A4R4ME68_9ACTN|nr:hypothetical protein E1267_43185 [Nonomuraea longispora]
MSPQVNRSSSAPGLVTSGLVTSGLVTSGLVTLLSIAVVPLVATARWLKRGE